MIDIKENFVYILTLFKILNWKIEHEHLVFIGHA